VALAACQTLSVGIVSNAELVQLRLKISQNVIIVHQAMNHRLSILSACSVWLASIPALKQIASRATVAWFLTRTSPSACTVLQAKKPWQMLPSVSNASPVSIRL
jgi:hypothetical protein